MEDTPPEMRFVSSMRYGFGGRHRVEASRVGTDDRHTSQPGVRDDFDISRKGFYNTVGIEWLLLYNDDVL